MGDSTPPNAVIGSYDIRKSLEDALREYPFPLVEPTRIDTINLAELSREELEAQFRSLYRMLESDRRAWGTITGSREPAKPQKATTYVEGVFITDDLEVRVKDKSSKLTKDDWQRFKDLAQEFQDRSPATAPP